MRVPALVLICLFSFACANGSPGVADGGSEFKLPGDSGTPPPPDPTDAGEPDAGQPDAGQPDAGGGPTHPSTLIWTENQKTGSSGWRLDSPSRSVGAYTDRTSAFPGDRIFVQAAASTATTASWELWRFGYYKGKGGRRLAAGGPVQLAAWSAPVLDPKLGSVSAQFPAAFSIDIPADATTGVYFVKLHSPLGDTYATFVVKDPVPGASILLPIATNTYQAYNDWGGTSLYANHRSDWAQWHAYAVSFDRPYQNFGAGEVFSVDSGLITFVEAQGYDVTYVSDADVDADPGLTADRRMVAYSGHTEYWTARMRDAARAAIASGENVAFFGANSAYWQVRFADERRRLLIGYKEFASLDPAKSSDPTHVTTRWRDPPLNAPENAMVGAMFGTWTWGSAPFTVSDPTSWLWAGTGVSAGTIIAGVYGDETDRRYDNGLTPQGTTVVANGFVENHDLLYAYAETTLYSSPSGGMVFDAGSITFGWALGRIGRWDSRIQQFAANLFSRFAGDDTIPAPLAPMNLPAGAPTPNWRPGVQVTTITTALSLPTAVAAAADGSAIVADGDRIVRVASDGTVSILAGSTAGFADGPAAQARFKSPRGVAVAADGTIFVSDSGNNRIRAISGGTVSTLAGSNQQGFADGAAPVFSQPMAIALTAAGTILVADTWNMRVREVTRQGVASTWAGSGAEGIQDGAGSQAQLTFPMGITVLPNGDAMIVEPNIGVMRKVGAAAPHTVSVVLGSVGTCGWEDGPASSATVSDTIAAAATKDGQVLLVDQAMSRIRALKNGVIDTVAGGKNGGTVDGAGSEAGFSAPRAVAVAPDGSVLVIDAREHALRRIRLP